MPSRLPTLLILVAIAISFAVLNSPGTDAAYPGTNDRIAFVVRDGQEFHIWTMAPDGSDRQQLTFGAVRDEQPRYSPDGMKIAFHRFIPDNGIWIIDANGGNPNLIPGTGEGYSLSWSPDGQTIVFEEFIGGEQTDISIIGIDGGGHQNLTQTNDTFEAFPDWSPDGERIVFQRANLNTNETDLWTMDANGQDQQQLTFSPVPGESYPDWSPDGSRVVYASSLDGGEIFVVDSGGGTPENLTDDDLIQRRPVFSPDGDSIAFDENADTLPAGGPAFFYIVVMDLGTRDTQNISDDQTPLDFGPDWSIGEPATLVWGDHDCSGGIDPLDALYGFRQAAEIVPAVPEGASCPALGETVPAAGFGDLTWGDLDCDEDIDGDDALLILTHAAEFPIETSQGCPEIGASVQEMLS